MADPTPTPTPTPAPKAKRQRSTINRKHLNEIANSRAVAKAAADPANAAALAVVEFDPTLPAQITTLADTTEASIGKLTGTRAVKTEMTAQETAARDALIAVIAPIQTAARRKFTGDLEQLRHAYFIGEGLPEDTLGGSSNRRRCHSRPAGGHAAAGCLARRQGRANHGAVQRRHAICDEHHRARRPAKPKCRRAPNNCCEHWHAGRLAASSATGRRTSVAVTQSRRGQHPQIIPVAHRPADAGMILRTLYDL